MRKGDTVASPAAINPAAWPASRRPARYSSGTVAMPASADSERRPTSLVPAIRAQIHATT
jgi:hypothetical protein